MEQQIHEQSEEEKEKMSQEQPEQQQRDNRDSPQEETMDELSGIRLDFENFDFMENFNYFDLS